MQMRLQVPAVAADSATAPLTNQSGHKSNGLPVHSRYPVLVSLSSGAVAGAIAKTVIAPLDRTKINFQITNRRYSFRKAFRFLYESYLRDGLLSWWRGNTATMARVVPYAALNYAAHEQWKIILDVDTDAKRKMRHTRSFLAGSLAGVTASSITYPLDLARARMAVSRCETYKNLPEVFLKIWRNEGPMALYRGLTPTLLGVIPYAGTSFFTYETLKRLRQEHKRSTDLHPGERLVFGALAGLLGQSSSYPLDIVRRRMQTSRLTGQAYSSVVGTLRYVYHTEGIIHGIYKGLSMNWIKGPVAVGISFMTYDIVKNTLTRITVVK